jgi:hypothetical protein
MNKFKLVSAGKYDPNHLLNCLIKIIGVTNDAGLARKLKVSERIIIMMRERKISISASMMMWLHEASGLTIEQLRNLLGDRRAKHRLTCCR